MKIDENIDYDILVRYFSHTATEEEMSRILTWVNERQENEDLFFSLKEIYAAGNWEKLKTEADTKIQWRKLASEIEKTREDKKSDLKILPVFISLLKYAAVLVIGIFIAITFQKNPKQNFAKPILTQNRVETGIGERSRVFLPDGTEVWLNACSSVSYSSDYGDSIRNIKLNGEAYFEVKKDKAKPFIVSASGFDVKALGTSFNVSAYDNDKTISAVLVEGSISFEKGENSTPTILKPGEGFFFSKESNTLKIKNVDTDTYTIWRTGEYRFDQLNFMEVSQKLERLFNIKVVLQNKKISNVRFTGTFKNYESLKQILEVICANSSLNYSIVKDTVYIR